MESTEINLAESELLAINGDLHRDLKRTSNNLLKINSLATALLLSNIIIVLLIGIIILSKISQGFSFSNFSIFISTLAFILINSVSIFLLSTTTFNVNKSQPNYLKVSEFKEDMSRDSFKRYYIKRIHLLEQINEEVSRKLLMTSKTIKLCYYLTGVSVSIYAAVVAFIMY